MFRAHRFVRWCDPFESLSVCLLLDVQLLDIGDCPVPPLDDRLHAAVDQVSDSLRYWADYLASNRAERLDNSFASTVALPAKGLTAARYEFVSGISIQVMP